MSASIYFRPVKTIKHRLPGQSSVVEALRRADIHLPCTLDKSDIETLRGMAATWEHNDNPYQAIIDALNKHISIEVWVEY